MEFPRLLGGVVGDIVLRHRKIANCVALNV